MHNNEIIHIIRGKINIMYNVRCVYALSSNNADFNYSGNEKNNTYMTLRVQRQHIEEVG